MHGSEITVGSKQVETSPYGKEIIELCDPLLALDNDGAFMHFSARVKELVCRLKIASNDKA